MDPIPLAAAQELVYLGAAVAVALLLVWQLRLAQRYRILDMEVQRLHKAQKDGSVDARSRLEEALRALEELERNVTPKLSTLEPHLVELGTRLDALEEHMARLAPEIEVAARREVETSEILAEARIRLDGAEETVQEVGQRFGAVEEGVRDATRRLEATEHGLDHLRTTFDERLEALDQKIAALETVPPPPPREPTRAALGLAHRRTRSATVAPTEETTDEEPEATARPEHGHEHAHGHGHAHEDHGAGMKGLLVGVILLAALTALLHFLGVGR